MFSSAVNHSNKGTGSSEMSQHVLYLKTIHDIERKQAFDGSLVVTLEHLTPHRHVFLC